jgi:7,8-dihydropterin-6-yl-methyl-4-(beta-D-ribofuranosyl)aminobenzene 5'-phosphate synthase
MRGQRGLAAATSVAVALAARYTRGRERADRQTLDEVDTALADLGTVERLSILPVVERYTADAALRGEPGVSYLVKAGNLTLLFDAGLGTGRRRTAFESNAAALGVSAGDLDCLVLSHLHADHVGGPGSQLRHTFTLGREQPLPRSLPVFVPTGMTHPDADLCVVDRARIIGPGVAVLPPLRRMLFWLGLVAEQALVVHVRGRGLILITGCGHPAIERMLIAAENVMDAPVCAVVGGLHLPVHPAGTPLLPQALLGNPNWPWRPIDEDDARVVIQSIRRRGPDLVALSGHDSTPWTLDAFGTVFGDRFRTLRVGEEVVINARPGA